MHICEVFPLFTSYSDYCAHKKICYIGEKWLFYTICEWMNSNGEWSVENRCEEAKTVEYKPNFLINNIDLKKYFPYNDTAYVM